MHPDINFSAKFIDIDAVFYREAKF